MAAKAPVSLIATLPPYVDHRAQIIGHPLVSELRFNTVSPAAETPREMLARLQAECAGKRLWIDLKARQLRIAKFAYLPHAFVELNHRITVNLPTEVLFKDGGALVTRIVDGNKLILNDRPGRVVGEGEPVNILDPSLRIEGFLTERDRAYVAAARELGLHDYLLSFTEQSEDFDEIIDLDPEANVIAKIESRRGLDFARRLKFAGGRHHLMAARDDLFINMGPNKRDFLPALRAIVRADPGAVVASRLLTSLEERSEVSCQDLSDLELMRRLGYRRFMLSDGLCFREAAFQAALTVLADLWSA